MCTLPAQVRICRERATGKICAMKKLRKSEMVRRGQVRHAGACRLMQTASRGDASAPPHSICGSKVPGQGAVSSQSLDQVDTVIGV